MKLGEKNALIFIDMCDDMFSNQTDIMKNHTYTHTYTHIHTHTHRYIILLCCTKLSESVDVTEKKFINESV